MSGMLLAVGFVLAAAAGTAVRAEVSRLLSTDLPWGTLAVNLAASFAAGLASGTEGAAATITSVGLLGALSTWSSLANEVRSLVAARRRGTAAFILGISIAGGVTLALAGLRMAGR